MFCVFQAIKIKYFYIRFFNIVSLKPDSKFFYFKKLLKAKIIKNVSLHLSIHYNKN